MARAAGSIRARSSGPLGAGNRARPGHDVRMMTRSALILAVASLVLAACGPDNAGPSSGPATPAVTASPDTSGSPSPGPGSSQAASPAPQASAVGLAFVNALAGGDMAAAEAMEDPTMRGAAPAAALTQLWSQFEGQFGAFTDVGAVTVESAAPFVNATVTAYFANATVPLIVTVDAEGRVAGLHLGAPGPAASPPGDSGATPDGCLPHSDTVRRRLRPPGRLHRDRGHRGQRAMGAAGHALDAEGEWAVPGRGARGGIGSPGPRRDDRAERTLARPGLGPGVERHRRAPVRQADQGPRDRNWRRRSTRSPFARR